MLVLSRKIGEKIVIPTLNATIQVVEVHGNSVRIGIQAPPEVPIVRSELLRDRCDNPDDARCSR